MVSANSANCQLALKLWLKFPETSRLSLKVCQCFFNKYDSHFLCFLVRMSCYPRTATFSCYDKLVNLFEDVFRENECDIERYLQSATKLFRRSPQMGQLRRTNQSSPHPSLSSPFKFGAFVVFYMKLEQRHNIVWKGLGVWGNENFISPFFKLEKRQRDLSGQSVSTNFVADSSSDSDPAGLGENTLISNLNCALC